MMVLLGLFIGVLTISTFIFVVILICEYCSHFFNSDFNKNKWDYANFKIFKKEFYKLAKDEKLYVDKNIIYNNNNVRLCPTIINLNGNYMRFNPIEWLKYLVWLVKFTAIQTSKREKGLWNND